MGFINKYPYTDYSELNLDWIIEKVDSLSLDIQGIEERATAAAVEASKVYIDAELAKVEEDFNALSRQVSELSSTFVTTVDAMQRQYNTFITQVNTELSAMCTRLDALHDEIQASIIGVNARTDAAIAENNEYIFSVIQDELPTELKVINFFTGERVSIQDMFNYLSLFHATNAASITAIANAQKTVNTLVALDHTMTEWAVNGSLYIA